MLFIVIMGLVGFEGLFWGGVGRVYLERGGGVSGLGGL